MPLPASASGLVRRRRRPIRMIVTALIGATSRPGGRHICSVPEVDRLLVRSVIDSYQIAVAQAPKFDSVEIQRFGWALGDQPPSRAIISEFGLSMHWNRDVDPRCGNVLVDFGFSHSAA